MPIKLANNASGTLATAINASDTGIALTTGDGAEFPTLGAGDYFYATITSTQGTQEIVKATARSGDSLTVVRAQEGTSAAGFAVGSRFELRVTAQSVFDAVGDVVASQVGFTPTGGVAATDVQAAIAELDTEKVAFTRLDDNDGASLVGFLQAGTGATTRTTQDKLRESVSVKDFGAVGDGVTDDWAAIRAALDSGASQVFFPAGTYYCTKCFNLKTTIILQGERAYQAVGSGNHSILQFANNCCGIIVHRADTIADDYGYNNAIQSPATTGADGTIIANLEIRRGNGSDTTIDDLTHGIRLRARAQVVNCGLAGWAGNGIHIQASATSTTPDQRGNANNFNIRETRIVNCNHGVYVAGADANAGTGYQVDATSNAGWGIWDTSFLGNTWIACHVSTNGAGQYKTDDNSARSVFVGCYQEGGFSDVIAPSIIVGGQSNSGAGLAGSAELTLGGLREYAYFQDNSSIGQVIMSNLGSGYTSAPTVTFSAPTGIQATATLQISNGRVVRAVVTNPGSGYAADPYPVITITGDGIGATAKASIINGAFVGITITDPGSGYTTATASIAAPTLTTATGTAVIDSAGQVVYVVINNRGAGYVSAPTVSFSGGGGSAAAATCQLRQSLFSRVICNNIDNSDYTSVLQFSRRDVATSDNWRIKHLAYTGDIELDYNNLGQTYYITGPKTTQTYGQAFAVGAQWMSISNLVLSGQRRVSMQSTVPPTSGQYARGEIIFALNPSAGGSPGVVCTTSGVAGSTAVFKAMANLAA